jgi:hypothetical protein
MVVRRCQRHEHNEDLLQHKIEGYLPANNSISGMSWPCFSLYLGLVRSFNVKIIRYESDALPAFSNILEAANRHCPSGFCQALPELYCDAAMLWQSVSVRDCRTLRPLHRLSGGGHHSPSWSWLGWKGELDTRLCHHSVEDPILVYGERMGGGPHDVQLKPITKWFKSTKDFTIKHPISNDFAKYQRLRVPPELDYQKLLAKREHDSSNMLLLDWTVFHLCPERSLSPSSDAGAEIACYRNPLYCEAFSYRLPVGHRPAPIQDPNMSFLQFRSRRSHLRITNKYIGPTFEVIGRCQSVNISDATGATIGLLHMNTDALPIEYHGSCEFIALSEATTKLRMRNDTFIGVLEEKFAMDYLMSIAAFRQNKAPSTGHNAGVLHSDPPVCR